MRAPWWPTTPRTERVACGRSACRKIIQVPVGLNYSSVIVSYDKRAIRWPAGYFQSAFCRRILCAKNNSHVYGRPRQCPGWRAVAACVRQGYQPAAELFSRRKLLPRYVRDETMKRERADAPRRLSHGDYVSERNGGLTNAGACRRRSATHLMLGMIL